VRAFRRRIAFIRAARDERDLYAINANRLKKLQGDRAHQRSMRLNDQWRLIIEVEQHDAGNIIVIVGVEDYHRGRRKKLNDSTNSSAIPPGEIIREELDERGWTQEDLARILGRPLAAVSEIIMGKRSITTQSARELAAAFGTSAELWMNLDSAYQLAKIGEPSGNVSRMADLFARAPVKDMERRGWIEATKDPAELERELCRFYRIDSITSEPALKMAARQSVSEGALTSAQVAWGCRALALAQSVSAAPYDEDRLRSGLQELGALAATPRTARKVPEFLASHGVRLVIVEQLPGTKMDGAALRDAEGRPVIAMSLRHDRIDSFWHTLAHEIVHVLDKDGDAMLDVDISTDGGTAWSVDPEKEQRANAEGAHMLIPRERLDAFILRVSPNFSKARILEFAQEVGIHPGIVVGQLQHRDKIGFHANRAMLVKIREHVIDSAMTDGFGHMPGLLDQPSSGVPR
jgi:HTH-type transcriptional regulator/antitoxin HigA